MTFDPKAVRYKGKIHQMREAAKLEGKRKKAKREMHSLLAEEFNFPTGGMSSWSPKKK